MRQDTQHALARLDPVVEAGEREHGGDAALLGRRT